MIVALVGRHGAGKSHLARLMGTCGWDVRLKQVYLEQLHRASGDKGNLITWYRGHYKDKGPRKVMTELLSTGLTESTPRPVVIDSLHNLEEWRALKERYESAVLVSVVAPRAVRGTRNSEADVELDIARIGYWHEGSPGSCLMAEVEWTFQGTVPDAAHVSNVYMFSQWLSTATP